MTLSPKPIAKVALRVALTIVLVFGLYLFLSQKIFLDNLFGQQTFRVFQNFVSEITTHGPFAIVRHWFQTDPSRLPLSQEEELTRYQLRILGRSLDNYFKSILTSTDTLIQKESLIPLFEMGRSADPSQDVRGALREYLQGNLDLMEISLYNPQGAKLHSVRYRTAGDYLLSPKVIEQLRIKDNILLKHSASPNLVLVSAVKKEGQLIGLVSQTLNPVFFTKILDFLNINQRLFYIKNNDQELVVDNYGAYQHLTQRLNSFSYQFYRKLTTSRESNMILKIDNVDYAIGVIIEENNMAGNILSLLALTLVVYLGIFLMSLIWRHSAAIRSWAGSLSPKRKPSQGIEFAEAAAPAPVDARAQSSVLPGEVQDEIDRELEKLRASMESGSRNAS